MRFAPLIMSVVFLAQFQESLHAQTESYRARVKVNEALVRSGPSLNAEIYPTNRLKRGDSVQVVKEAENDWLQITPPSGSFSWINQRFIEKMSSNTWMVSQDNTEVFYGSTLRKEQPNKVSVHLAKGTQLFSNGRMNTDPKSDGLWLRISPPPSEVRYIQAQDVEKIEANVAKATPTARGQESEPTDPDLPPAERDGAKAQIPAAPAPSQPAGPATATVADAQRAERMGDRQNAIRLWTEVGRAYEKNENLAMNNRIALRDQCYKRADWLKTQGPTARSQNNCYAPCAQLQPRCWPGTMDGRVAAVPAARLQPVPVQTASNVYSAPGPAQAVTWNPVVPQPQSEMPQSNSVLAANVFRGYLTPATKNVDGKKAYMLHSPTNGISYVVAEPGVDLDRFLRANVEIEGAKAYRSDLRADVLKASSVKGLQQP